MGDSNYKRLEIGLDSLKQVHHTIKKTGQGSAVYDAGQALFIKRCISRVCRINSPAGLNTHFGLNCVKAGLNSF
jgi:hypothetical protein